MSTLQIMSTEIQLRESDFMAIYLKNDTPWTHPLTMITSKPSMIFISYLGEMFISKISLNMATMVGFVSELISNQK